MSKLDPAALQEALATLPGWTGGESGISRQFTCPTFPDAILFATRIAFDAEGADHHPDLLISYRKVTVTWCTHSAGGVTDKDIAAASMTDKRFVW
jgi:4a-hydroxytetrahydrobiopterin dehydratase